MALLSVAELRTHVSTDLADAAVQRLLDDAEAEMAAWAGPVGAVTERHTGGGTHLILRRSASAITSVTETSGGTDYELEADDYELVPGSPYLVKRLDTGTNQWSLWYPTVEITYTAADDVAVRKRIQVDLVKLALGFSGVGQTAVGGYSESPLPNTYENRVELMRPLRSPGLVFVG